MTTHIYPDAFDDGDHEPLTAKRAYADGQVTPARENEIVGLDGGCTEYVKTFERQPDGTIVGHPFDPPFKAKPRVFIIRNLLELYLFLRWIELRCGYCVLRGHPLVTTRKVRRLLHAKDGDEATFEDAARSWLCIDIDSLPMPPGLSYACPADLAEYAVSLLPKAQFWDVSYVWQLSSSAGLKSPHLIKLHLWFWLDTPRTSAELRGWAKSLKGLIDPALYNPVQPHITARPIFIGMEDPFVVRTGLVLRRDQAVRGVEQLQAPPAVPAPPKAQRVTGGRKAASRQTWNTSPGSSTPSGTAVPGGRPFAGWPPYLDEMERTQNFHSPIWCLLLSYFGRGGTDITDLKAALRREIPLRNTSNRSDVNDRYLTDEYLDEQIASAIAYINQQQVQKA